MRRSIRARLQVWYGLVLVLVVAGLAGSLYYRARVTRLQEVDGSLEAAARYLDEGLRRLPPIEFGEVPDEYSSVPPTPPGFRRSPPGPPLIGAPGLPNRERLFRELDLPMGGLGADSGGMYFGIWRGDDTLLKARNLPDAMRVPALVGPEPRFRQRRGAREVTLRGPGATRILVGKSLRREVAELRSLAWQLTCLSALVLGIGLAGGWFISTRVLQPLAAISATAATISETNLSARIDADTVDEELVRLARILNAAFERLESAFQRQARFTADASHELRTPLAIVRTHAELALSRPRSAAEYQDALRSCLNAATRMTTLVEGLLTLARADAGKLDLACVPVDLKELVAENVALFRPVAESKAIAVIAALSAARVAGDPIRLGQVVINLLSNAAQYNRPGGEIRVSLASENGTAVLSVADTGCGIADVDQPHIFERFYRADKARSRASGGNGLGLAICKWIVEAHQGTIGFTSAPQGSTFTVRIPTLP